uniref:EOG090X0A55 n=1 Tax=Scapholeberis mucronata TaxID=202097 RepID=A0A4Y7NME1_9CRUS|nr:EOG090X0A55 [Scapholeberis mucronata]SVE93764.1 EOG090X0A55 [Scapholeberis mucronata]
MSCGQDQEVLVKESLLAFLKDNIPNSNLSYIDEIVLSYVVSILEELGTDFPGQEDVFDVESFSEMLSAYFPDFASIPHSAICDWIFELSAQLSTKMKKDSKGPGTIHDLRLTFPIPAAPKIDRLSPRVSESSDASISDSSHCSYQESDKTEDVRLLLEMFPSISLVEAAHCISLSNGSVEEAVQLVLHRQEIGESISTPENTSLHKTRPVNDTTLKKKIIEKYSYIDQDDDQREHRPPPVKTQPKKMVRYLDNKVVTIKGERYTEIKEETDESKEDAKKTFVALKPARQYRFH